MVESDTIEAWTDDGEVLTTLLVERQGREQWVDGPRFPLSVLRALLEREVRRAEPNGTIQGFGMRKPDEGGQEAYVEVGMSLEQAQRFGLGTRVRVEPVDEEAP